MSSLSEFKLKDLLNGENCVDDNEINLDKILKPVHRSAMKTKSLERYTVSSKFKSKKLDQVDNDEDGKIHYGNDTIATDGETKEINN